jgi:hypothetical protein
VDGRIVANRYLLERELGSEGTATVWLGTDQVVGRTVAVKEVRPPGEPSEQARDAFGKRAVSEASAAARVSQPGAGTLHDIVPATGEDDAVYLVMEYIEGRDPVQLLRDYGPVPEAPSAELPVAPTVAQPVPPSPYAQAPQPYASPQSYPPPDPYAAPQPYGQPPGPYGQPPQGYGQPQPYGGQPPQAYPPPPPYPYSYAPPPPPPGSGVISNGRRALAAGLIGLGVVISIIGLFPDFEVGVSLTQTPYELAFHAIYIAAWIGTAAWILKSRTRPGDGGLFGLVLGITALTDFVGDIAGITSSGGPGVQSGLIISMIGWLAAVAGAAVCFRFRPTMTAPVQSGVVRGGSLSGTAVGLRVLLVLAIIGVDALYLPGWFHYSIGRTSYGTNNGWDYPAAEIAVDAVYMLVLLVIAAVAARWRSSADGLPLLAGAAAATVAQVAVGFVTVAESPYGTGSYATDVSFTVPFWLYVVFAVGLCAALAWAIALSRAERGSAA